MLFRNTNELDFSAKPNVSESYYSFSTKEIRELFKLEEKLALLFKNNILNTSSVLHDLLHQRGILNSFSLSMNNMVQSISSVNKNIQTADKAFDVLNTTIENHNISITKMADTIGSISDTLKKNSNVSHELDEATNNGYTKVNEVLSVIKVLSTNIASIRDIMSAIDDISERTNLLAMNAAIEAAHAGKAGAGFAVVAGEIRKLSEGTKINSGNIEKSLQNMIGTLDNVLKIAEEAGAAMKFIAEKVDGTKVLFNSLDGKVFILNEGKNGIISSSQGIMQESERIKDSLTGVAEEVKSLVSEIEITRNGFNSIKTHIEDVEKVTHSDMYNMTEIISNTLEVDDKTRTGVYVGEESKQNNSELFPASNIILHHLVRVTSLRSFLDGKALDDINATKDEHSCALGVWLKDNAHKFDLDKHPLYKELSVKHIHFHELVRKIIQEKRNLSALKLEDEYQKLLQCSGELITLISKIGSSLEGK